MGMDLKDEDYIEHLFVASTHDYILFFSTKGKVYRLKVHELPLGARQSKGRAIVNLLPFTQDEQVKTVIRTRDFSEAKYLVLATRKGIVKKTEFAQYNTPLKSEGIIAVNLREDDELIDAFLTQRGTTSCSSRARARRFASRTARCGRWAATTGGVIGMKLRAGDEVIAAMIADDNADLLVVTENGYGKRTRMCRVPRKGRGRHGRADGEADRAQGQLAGARIVREGYQVMLISDGGQVIRMPTEGIRRAGRSTQGVIVMRLREGEQVSTLAPVIGADDERSECRRRDRSGSVPASRRQTSRATTPPRSSARPSPARGLSATRSGRRASRARSGGRSGWGRRSSSCSTPRSRAASGGSAAEP